MEERTAAGEGEQPRGRRRASAWTSRRPPPVLPLAVAPAALSRTHMHTHGRKHAQRHADMSPRRDTIACARCWDGCSPRDFAAHSKALAQILCVLLLYCGGAHTGASTLEQRRGGDRRGQGSGSAMCRTLRVESCRHPSLRPRRPTVRAARLLPAACARPAGSAGDPRVCACACAQGQRRQP